MSPFRKKRIRVIGETERKLIETLGSVANCRRYYGELGDMEEPYLKDGELPLILVDFIGDMVDEGRELIFHIYFIHLTPSKSAREQKFKEAISLIEAADKEIVNMRIEGTTRLKRLRKIFDAATKKGYLSVFTREVGITLYDYPYIGSTA